MTVRFQCGDGAALVGYAYDEGPPQEMVSIAAHLATCAPCADEVKAIQNTREELRTWTPPEVSLGFRIAAPLLANELTRPARWWRQPLPAWAQVAAAVALFVTGVGLGAMRGGGVSRGSNAEVAGSAARAVSVTDLAALEARLKNEFASMRGPAGPERGGSGVPVASTAGGERRVRNTADD